MPFSVNDSFLYILSGIIVLFVVAQSAFFLIKAVRRARQLSISGATIRKTVLSSALFSIAPAVSILVGVITLSKFIGLPFPWLRLSVLGAVTYELPAATIAANTMGASVKETITNPQVFSTIAWTMTLGIISGIVLVLFGLKKIQRGMHSITGKDKRWGEIVMDSLFLGMVSAFVGMLFADIRSGLPGRRGRCVERLRDDLRAADGGLRRVDQGLQMELAGAIRSAAVHALRHGVEHPDHGADGVRRG